MHCDHFLPMLLAWLLSVVFFSTGTASQSATEDIITANLKSGALENPNTDGYGDGLFEGDIRLHSRSRQKVTGKKSGIQYGATAVFDQLWPNSTIYYTMSEGIIGEEGSVTKLAIEEAMKEIQDKTCIKILPRKKERDYVYFYKERGCWSLIGRVGGKQEISIGTGCEYKGVVIHELMHSLGFWHEQSRPDRDTYVEIVFKNVMEDYKDQFQKYDSGTINSRNSPYDYKSVMHYGAKAFSRNGEDTVRIRKKGVNVVLGQRQGLSEIDLRQLKQLYKCDKEDSKFGEWGDWSACTAVCGGGVQTRSRVCNAPKNGGADCVGPSKEERVCNIKDCPAECDFEDDFCGWKNGRGDQFDWSRRSGSTPSPYTGPTVDHTFGDKTGTYVYIESSAPQALGHVALLESPVQQGSLSLRCFDFWYSMDGSTMGTIKIDLQIGSTLLPMWVLSGNQGKKWNPGSFTIPVFPGKFKIIISGIIGSDFRGDAAIDDILLVDGSCPTSPPEAQPIVDRKTTEVPTTVPRATTAIPTTRLRSTTELPTIASTTEILTTEQVTTRQPTTEQPTTEQSTTEQPTTEQPTTDLPTTEKRTTTQMATTKLRTTTEVPTQLPDTMRVTTFQPVTVPTTQTPIIPGDIDFCDFESGCETWQNGPAETKWFRNFGRTPSGSTGPSVDHTLGTRKAFYIYLESSSPRKPGDRARLVSKELRLSDIRCLQFFYFMYGSNINELNVYVTFGSDGEDLLLWTLKGEQGKEWKQANVPLPYALVGSRVIIEGKVGSGFRGDIAIDDIALQSGDCLSMPPDAAVSIQTTPSPTPPTEPPTEPPTQVPVVPTAAPENAIRVEVSAEGCEDPIVRKRTIAAMKLTGPLNKRKKRNPQYDQDYFGAGDYDDGDAGEDGDDGNDDHGDGDYSDGDDGESDGEGGDKQDGVGDGSGPDDQSGSDDKVDPDSDAGITEDGDSNPDPDRMTGRDIFGRFFGRLRKSSRSSGRRPQNKRNTKRTSSRSRKRGKGKRKGSRAGRWRKRRPGGRKRKRPQGGKRKRLPGGKRKRPSPAGKRKKPKGKKKPDGGKKKPDGGKKKPDGGKKKPDGGKKKPDGGKKKPYSTKKPIQPDTTKPTTIPATTEPIFVINDCSLAWSSIKVNGIEYSTKRPGHNVVAISKTTGIVFAQKNFPTNYNFIAGIRMENFIKTLPFDTIIAIATQDTAHATYFGQATLRLIGAKAPYYPYSKGSWAFIGYKGSKTVGWIQQEDKIAGQGPARVSAVISPEVKPKPVQIRILLKYAVFSGTQYLPIPPKYNKFLDFGYADFTLSAWVKTTKGGTIVSKSGPQPSLEPYLKLIYIEDGFVKVRLGRNAKASTIKVDDDKWNHIAVAIEAASRPHTGSLYINGREDTTLSFDAVHDFDDYTVKVGYGVKNFPPQSAFIGSMRNVAYYNVALQKEQVFDKIRDEKPKESKIAADARGYRISEDSVFGSIRSIPL